MRPGDCVMQLRGYLLKRNKEHRKANLLGGKYNRRWVELTPDTLVYAKSQQELLSGGKIEVFSLQQLIWVKRDGDAKFQVKFPERVLVFKVDVGGSSERDRWVAVLEQAKVVGKEGQEQRLHAEQLQQLKKEAEEILLDPNSSDGSFTSIPACRAALPAAGFIAADGLASADRSAGSRAGIAGLGPASAGVAVRPTDCKATETGGRPLSPRSLLASAKAGCAFVGSSGGDLMYRNQAGRAARVQQHDSESDDASSEHSSDAPAGLHANAPAPAQGGSVELACNSPEMAMHVNTTVSSGNSTHGTTPVEAPAAAQDTECIAYTPGSTAPTTAQERRISLQRRLTPGVMLIDTSLPPISDTESPAQQPAAVTTAAVLKLSERDGSCSAIYSQGPTASTKHASQQLQYQCSSKSAATDTDLPDEILRLDPADLGTHSTCTLASSEAPAARTPGICSSMHATARPGSAPQYRPGTPLKSCLRGSNNNISCSSSAGSSQQLLGCSGSYSMPASSAEAAAAAAAAVASLGFQRGAARVTSPLSKVIGTAHGHQGDVPALASSGVERGWVEDDWDEWSDDGLDSGRTCPGEHHVINRNSVEERHGPVATGRKSAHQHADSSPIGRAGACGSGVVTGVATDRNWLEDDFDN